MIWKPVVGYEGLYEVSNHGRVRSLDRMVEGQPGVFYMKPGRVLKINPGHYPNVRLSKNGVGQTREIHSLVAEAFLGPVPEGMEVCHGSADREDNRLSNLRYDTRAANSADRYRDGTHQLGSQNPSACLTEDQVHAIRKEIAAGVSNVAIARKFNVSPSNVSAIKRRKSWAHV